VDGNVVIPVAAEADRSAVVDPLRPLRFTRGIVAGSVVALVIVVAAGSLLAHAAGRDSLELAVLQWLSDHHTTSLSGVALGIAWVFSPPIALAITSVGGLVIAAVTRNITRAITFWLVVGLSFGGSEVVKQIVRRARPDGTALAHPLAIEQSFSFPSGHTCFAAALGIAILFLVRDHRVGRIVGSIVVAIAVVAVAGSRMYIGVHYPTDVVAGILYAIASSELILALWLGLVLPRIREALESRRPVRG
jgi:membrane-associated phospholipid phosphatase